MCFSQFPHSRDIRCKDRQLAAKSTLIFVQNNVIFCRFARSADPVGLVIGFTQNPLHSPPPANNASRHAFQTALPRNRSMCGRIARRPLPRQAFPAAEADETDGCKYSMFGFYGCRLGKITIFAGVIPRNYRFFKYRIIAICVRVP